jgi:hypothetical protein
MKMKGNATSLLIAGTVILLSQNDIQAATTWTGATDLNYGTATNWNNGSPGNTDGAATINNGNTVSLATAHTGTNPYTLTVAGSSTLNASANFTSTRLLIQNTGIVNLTGGAFTLPGAQNGLGLTIDAGGTLNISGGTHTINQRTVNYGTFRVDGSGSGSFIGLNQIQNGTGVFDFIFDSGGISTLKGVSDFAWFSLATHTVTVNASAVAGIVGSYTLFDSHAAGTMFTADKVAVDPSLGVEGVDWNLVITENVNGSGLRDTVVLNVIPEPSSAGLLGIALAGLLFRRKRG